MNKKMYQKVKTLAERSPYPGERKAARAAMARMDAGEEPTPEDYQALFTIGWMSEWDVSVSSSPYACITNLN